MDRIVSVKKPNTNLIRDHWIWKLAWKDAKNNWLRLLLFIFSIVIGIAALVAVNSFNDNLLKDIDNQARAFLAADVVLYANEDFTAADSLFFDSISNEQANDARLSSMISFPKSGATRLAQVTAIQGDYPFYGPFETTPENALQYYRQGQCALVDENMALQYKLAVDDTLKVGDLMLPIAGFVTKIPGNVNISASFAPSVYIPLDSLEKTGLVRAGSRVYYRKYFKALNNQSEKSILTSIRPAIKTFNLSWETAAFRKENLGKGFENIFRFLNLLGFMALILGSIGSASSVVIYLKEKHNTIAILRCLGISSAEGFLIFFIQTVALGLIGSLLGIVFGHYLQMYIPFMLADFIPIKFNFGISWKAVLLGLGTGLTSTLLFSFLALRNIKYISPLKALQTGQNVSSPGLLSKIGIIAITVIATLILAIIQSKSALVGSGFMAGITVTCLVMYLIAKLLIFTMGTLFLRKSGFVWRQGMINLFRPNNQTMVLVIVLGMSTFLMATLNLVQNNLIEQVNIIGNKSKTDLVLFDVQPHQLKQVDSMVIHHNVAVNRVVPIITLRFEKIRNKRLGALKDDKEGAIPNWILYMEHLVTYRDELLPSEKIIEGEFVPVKAHENDSTFISITKSMAEQLHVGIGDAIDFNVHGLSLKTYVGSIRKLDWQRIQNNFMFVFPSGVLEKAPQHYAYLIDSPDKNATAQLQAALSDEIPNISSVDLQLILGTLDTVIDKTAFVVRFMAFFCIITSLIVLGATVLNTRQAKIRENILLRTLGASEKQVNGILLLEYVFIGLFAGLTGIILSILSGWGLTAYFFDLLFIPDFKRIFVLLLATITVTVVIGWLHNKSILNQSPMEVLKQQK
ncbi:FtsX-like permease family protein [Fulvivirgaceae bacterium BMA12]|uniref:FtsX-like permease family protein n=1 Tax=Agaribacillus aureus TaxID=3051825 RepID=A0ABT8LAR3_9BACT|nr:FtsX-like permease family protein [Fulvivirgaceae bacterium BMA12]